MRNKWCCNRLGRERVIKRTLGVLVFVVGILGASPCAMAGDAPPWMHALINAPLPQHDDKTDAVLLYSERNVAVESPEKIKISVREAYKILRPGGREYGEPWVPFHSPNEKVTGLRGWSIPAQGKDYEVRDGDVIFFRFNV